MRENLVLLIIDMQSGLLKREVYNKRELVNNINRMISIFVSKEEPVILTRHTNNSFSKEHTDDWQIDSSITSVSHSVLFDKSHSSIFKEKPFTTYLKDNNITTLVITGLVSNGCVQAACLDARKHGLSVILIGDGHSTFHKDAEKTIISWNTKLLEEGIKVISTDEFCSQISLS